MEGQTFRRKMLKSHEIFQKIEETTKVYLAKKKQIQETRIAKLQERMEEKERKEKSQAEERENLQKQLNEYGGL